MLKRLWQLIWLTISIWNGVNASRMSAALTYYTMLSLAPTLMIAVAIAGYVYDSKQAQNEIIEQVSIVTNPEIATTVGGLIKNAVTPGSGLIAGLISISILIFAASGVFTQLYDTFNDIWDVSLDGKGILFSIQKRLVGIAMVLIVGLMLIGALVLDSTVTYLNELVAGSFPILETWLSLADRSLSFLVMPGVFMLLFWFLPSTRIHWGDIWPAAILTSAMVLASRYLIGLYLRFSTTSEVYAASSSLVVLLIWVYMTGLVVFLGASFSHAWAQVYGSRSEFSKLPNSNLGDADDNKGDEPDNDSLLSEPNSQTDATQSNLVIPKKREQELTSNKKPSNGNGKGESNADEKETPLTPSRRDS